jgi:hypothetical protein
MMWGHHMFVSASLEQLDPALLAFVKCHVTSPLKWEALRVLAEHDGLWVERKQLAREAHKLPLIASAMSELVAEGLVEELDGSYRLRPDEPTSVVLHRLIEVTRHSQDWRALIATYLLQRGKGTASASAAA